MPDDMTPLVSISETSRRLGVDRRTIADLIRVHALPTHRMAGTGLARGIDRPTFRRLAKLVNHAPSMSA